MLGVQMPWHTYGGAAGRRPVHALTLGVTLHAGLVHHGLPRLPETKTTEQRVREQVVCEEESPDSPRFGGQKLNCKHVKIQCLTEICKDKQM